MLAVKYLLHMEPQFVPQYLKHLWVLDKVLHIMILVFEIFVANFQITFYDIWQSNIIKLHRTHF